MLSPIKMHKKLRLCLSASLPKSTGAPYFPFTSTTQNLHIPYTPHNFHPRIESPVLMASEDIQPSSHWYVTDLNLTLQFHNHGLVIICILVLSIISLITIVFFHFIRQCRQFSASTRNAAAATVPPQNKGLDEATINSLPVFMHSSLHNSSEEEGIVREYECCICLGLFEENDRIKAIPRCMHVYHSECVDKWLHNQASCPLCRSTLHSSTALQLNA